ncbi:MAG: response regulator [Pirellulales bacterium]
MPKPAKPNLVAEPTVYVVDDDPQVRKSLCLIAQSVQLNVEAYETAQEFLDNYRPDRPGCLVLDVCLPGMNGLELQSRMASLNICLPTIIVTAYGEVPMAVRAIKAGALDFIQKPYGRQEMVDRIQEAVSRDLAQRRETRKRDSAVARLASLSPREREVMELFVSGKNTKKIATLLKISAKTVDFHRWNVLEKMHAKNMVDLAHHVARYLKSPPDPSSD